MQAGVLRASSLALLALVLGVAWTLFQAPEPARSDDPHRPPNVSMGMPLPGGGALWRHTGVNRPEDAGDVTWRLEPDGTRTFQGRTVNVMRYVAHAADGSRVQAQGWDQADFVDPATGEVVGGLDGWGLEHYPDEGSAAAPCPGR